MQIRKLGEATRHQNSVSCTAYEYKMPTRELDSALIELAGRYPEEGWAMNAICTSLVHVITGKGWIVSTSGRHRLTEDAQILIEKGEKYAFEGTMKLLYSAVPAWTPDQAKNVT